MDRNTWNSIIGFTLIFVIIFAWAKLNSPSAEEAQQQKNQKESLAKDSTPLSNASDSSALMPIHEPTITGKEDSATLAQQKEKLGPFAKGILAEEKEYILENEKVKLVFSNKGGRITSVFLKDYKKVTHELGKEGDEYVDLHLMQDERNRFDYLFSLDGRQHNTGDYIFEAQQTDNQLKFILQDDGGRRFEQEYTLKPSDYALTYVLKQEGFDFNAAPLTLEWKNYLDKLEKNSDYEKIFSTVYYKPAESSPDYCSCRESDQQVLDLPVKWVSHSNQFFNSTLIATQPFASGEMRTEMPEELDSSYLKVAYSKLVFPPIASGSSYAMELFVGPNEYTRLRAYGENVEDIIPFGWSFFGTVNRHIIRPVFTFLSSFDLNKGIVILLLTLLVKMVLYPLTYKMLKSQAKMGALKPKMAHLKEKFKDDAQQMQIETMKIYREFGVNPLGGCLPMVLQMPIWIALYRFFPASIEFRQEGFLWADDLSSYDAFVQLSFNIPFYGDHISLFTLIWVITTIIYTYYSTKDMDMSINPAMKYVQYFMPIMFLFWFNNYASGLTAYMCISNILNIGQTIITKNYIINHEKIKAQLELNKLKPKKKSSFQERLETALKEQQKKQQDRVAPGKKTTK